MRRGKLSSLLLLLSLLPGPRLAGQSAPSPAPELAETRPATSPFVERLTRVGRLWGIVRYLHPYLAYREIDWDAALMSAIPRLRAASGPGEYAKAVQAMLDALRDPVTRVLPEPPAEEAAARPASQPELFRWLEGEVLAVDLGPEIDLLDPKISQEGAKNLYGEIRKAKRVVIDLRSKPGAAGLGLDPFDVLDLTSALVGRPATAPTQRYLLHSGYVGQTFKGSGGYSSGLVTLLSQTFLPAQDVHPGRVVFLVNAGSAIPPLALALQAAGDAALVAEGGAPTEGGVVRTRIVDLGEGVRAEVRMSELVPQPGWPGLHADLVVPAGQAGGDDTALEAARRFTLAPPPKARSATAPAAVLPAGLWRPDRSYADQKDPTAEMRLLAVVRLWNVIALFYPYKPLIGDWEAVLPEFLAKMEASRGARGYAWTLAEMAARIADGHTRISGHPELDALFGVAAPPFATRWIEGACVVTALPDPPEGQTLGIEIGDAVESVDGKPIAERLDELEPYVPGATETWLRTRLCGSAIAGAKESTATIVFRGLQGERREVQLRRGPWKRTKPGEVVQILPGNLGYADLTRLTTSEVDAMFEQLKDTRALVFDMRGYPRGTAWSIAPRINVRNSRVAASFRRRLISGLDSEEETESGFDFLQPLANRTEGKYTRPTVMLIDERAISQSEHSGLFYEAANGTRFIGTPTAGSNGDVTDLALPGGITVLFTGHDVRHADGRQLQRIGLVPDVTAAPTRAGLHAGRDEVLERALQELELTLPPPPARGPGR